MRRRVVIFVKQPRVGRVKTRLGAGIGKVAATWWYRRQCRTTIARLLDTRWELVLAVSPDQAVFGADWPINIARIPQGKGDLGHRMGRILNYFAPDPTLIVGSDIPQIDARAIQSAFKALERTDSVIGPAPDGGFWLIGARGRLGRKKPFFGSVRWSTQHALSDTLKGLNGDRVAFIQELSDVDEAKDLN